jgi:ABC-type transport system involved in multi-copper enzyme maturation permease subunit
VIGSVLAQELMLGSRRGLPVVLRRIYTAWLVLQFLGFYLFYVADANLLGKFVQAQIDPSAAGRFGDNLAQLLVWQALILLVLLTPAFTAGAITDEKSRGTLLLVFASGLTAGEIVAGKLLGRLAQVALLSLGVLPLLCFLVRWSQVGLAALATLAAISVVIMFALGSFSLLASVWSRQTREAVVAVFFSLLIGYLLWLGMGPPFLNPQSVLDPALTPTPDWALLLGRLGSFACAWSAAGSLCLLMAVWRLRPAAMKQLGVEASRGRPRWWRWNRAPVSDRPVHWKERHLEGIAPFPWVRWIPRWVGVGLVLLSTLSACVYFLIEPVVRHYSGPDLLDKLRGGGITSFTVILPDPSSGFTGVAMAALFLATLVVGIRCSGAITGERERRTWDALLMTPLTVKQLVRGKLWGIVGATRPYLLAYTIPLLSLSLLGGPFLLLRILVLLGVTLLAMLFMGAAGLLCSAQYSSSWRSLMATTCIGYVGGFLVYVVAWPVVVIVFLGLGLAFALLDLLYGTALAQAFLMGRDYWILGNCLAIIGVFIAMTEFFLSRAEVYIASRERTRHWDQEPNARPQDYNSRAAPAVRISNPGRVQPAP